MEQNAAASNVPGGRKMAGSDAGGQMMVRRAKRPGRAGGAAGLHRLLRHTGAATALEAALVAPVYIGAVVMLFQIVANFFWQEVLDFATQSAARQIQLGSAQTYGSLPGFMTNVVNESLHGLLSLGNVRVDLQAVPVQGTLPDFSAAIGYKPPLQPDGEVAQHYCLGQPGQALLLHMIYLEPVFAPGVFGRAFPLLTMNGSTVLPIVSTAAFVDEQFTPATGGASC